MTSPKASALLEMIRAAAGQLASCVQDKLTLDRLRLGEDPLRAFNVTQTPVVFINGEAFEGPKFVPFLRDKLGGCPDTDRAASGV